MGKSASAAAASKLGQRGEVSGQEVSVQSERNLSAGKEPAAPGRKDHREKLQSTKLSKKVGTLPLFP